MNEVINTPPIFEILFEDENLIAINKPTGILVHRTKISEDTQFVLQLLRDQIKQRIYPIHRIDRPTSGVLIFGKNKEAAGKLATQFREQTIDKNYLAVVRGFLPESGTIDYPLSRSDQHEKQEAISHYTKISEVELDFFVNRYPTSRYTLVSVKPQTGRHHQIRRHFAHLRHPIIGDRPHGDCKHNKYFREKLNIKRMLLHAQTLSFIHPYTSKTITLKAPLDKAFLEALKILKLSLG